MADPNDQARQQAHADAIRQRTDERRLTPEMKEARDGAQEMEKIKALIEQKVTAALANFTIQSGNCMSFSGSGPNITGAWVPPPAPPSTQLGPTEGSWRSITDCDGVTFDVWVRNVVAP